MRRRTWIYAMRPQSYEIACDKCNGSNIHWSEYQHMIWCYKCNLDTPGTVGVFDGPIPLEVSKMLGVSFDRIHLKSHKLMKMMVPKNGKRVYWKMTDIDMRKGKE